MTDREKVLKALEHHKETAVCIGCPYAEDIDTAQGYCPIYDDAIALLREQEPVVPENHMPDETCPACGAAFIGELSYYLGHTYKKYYRHCPGCGRRVKWDD